jgi:hypothetical protein
MAKAPTRIGIDLTPVLPGSENGGAKYATLQFIKTLLSDFTDQFHLTLFVPRLPLKSCTHISRVRQISNARGLAGYE